MVPTSIGRARLEATPDGLRIIVPCKWNWLNFLGQAASSSFLVLLAWKELHSEPVALVMILVMFGLFILTVLAGGSIWQETIPVTRDLPPSDLGELRRVRGKSAESLNSEPLYN